MKRVKRVRFLCNSIGIGILLFCISCASKQPKEIAKPLEEPSPTPTVNKRTYPIPSPDEKKIDENGCQIYKKENFPEHSGKEDGRFTLGVKEKRIMFGYPLPLSTSHFVIQVNGLYGSNSNVFGCKSEYLLATGDDKEKTFQFHGIEIIQKLIPVSKDLQATDNKDSIQYYKIEYNLKNTMDYPQKINFSLLVDTMVDNNDSPSFSVNKKFIQSEKFLGSDQIPANILVFQESKNFNKIVAEFLLKSKSIVPPQEIFIGKWPEFYRTLDSIKIAGEKFLDSAVFLRWREVGLEPTSAKTLSTYYGLHSTKYGGLQHKYNHTSGNQKTLSLFFRSGSATLSLKEKKKMDDWITSEIKDQKVLGIAITGHSDAQGKDKLNLNLSQKRTVSVFKYTKARTKLKENLFILKSLGESLALDTQTTRQKGNEQDRKVDVIFFLE